MQLPLLLRGFVVLGVMLMHTAWFFSQGQEKTWVAVSGMLLDILSLFAVPLFMFISGYIFVSRHRHADAYSFSFCRKMTMSVLSPYLLFSLLYIGGAYYFNDERYTPDRILELVVTGSAAVHLGFFRALFGFYLFYPLIIRCFQRCRKNRTLRFFFSAVVILQIVWKTANNMQFADEHIAELILAATFLRYIAYFSFGISAYFYRRKILRWIDGHFRLLEILLLLSVPLIAVCWLAKYYWKSYPLLEFCCFPLNLLLYTIIIAMLFRRAEKLAVQDSFRSRFITYIGNYSFGIFLLHIIFMYIGVKALGILSLTPQDIFFYPLLFIIMLTMSICAMELLVRLPLHEYIIGSVSNLHIFRRSLNLRKETAALLQSLKRISFDR